MLVDLKNQTERAPSAKTMGAQHSVPFEAHLSSATQLINCYVSCDDIGKTDPLFFYMIH